MPVEHGEPFRRLDRPEQTLKESTAISRHSVNRKPVTALPIQSAKERANTGAAR